MNTLSRILTFPNLVNPSHLNVVASCAMILTPVLMEQLLPMLIKKENSESKTAPGMMVTFSPTFMPLALSLFIDLINL